MCVRRVVSRNRPISPCSTPGPAGPPRGRKLVQGEGLITVIGRRSEDDPRRAALARIAAEAVALFAGAGTGAELLRACPAPGCVLYFVKSHSRREWCTVGCGNRVRVARHSRRGRDATR
ncbi:CGNR zinc finger domain-containing protein [Streptomyces sp. NBC_01102]|uniref:CGNR zinc finger domain-containing protein n=1 Tax=Streptomyces sp. NBC_01102 TaxID=2903749 RepID=UPI003864F794